MADPTPSAAGTESSRDALDAFLRSIRPFGLLSHEQVVELSRSRAAAETGFRHALFSVPEVADAMLALWSERRSQGRVTGMLAEDDGTSSAARTRRIDRAFAAVELLRAQAHELRGQARIGLETQLADQLHAAGLALEVLFETRRGLDGVRGRRARAALDRADAAFERWTEARGRIVRHNLRLVVNIATRYRRDDVPLLDMIQEGVIGLVRAAEKFDPERGFRFSTYAVWWIEQALIRSIQKQARTVRLPAHVHEQQLRYRRAAIELDALGPGASAAEHLADRLGVSAGGLDQIESSLTTIRSLDAPTGPEDSGTLSDRLVDAESPDPMDGISRTEIRSVIQQQLRRLSVRETEILSQRFGLDGGSPQTLDEIGSRLGLSRERVRQIERQILDRLGEAPSVRSLAEATR